MKQIPLHSLVIYFDLVGNAFSADKIINQFAKYETLKSDAVCLQIFGRNMSRDMRDPVLQTISSLTNKKLENGERAAVFFDEVLKKRDRLVLTNYAKKQGIPVFYVVNTNQAHLADMQYQEILSGDGFANVIDANQKYTVVKKFETNSSDCLIKQIKQAGFAGITAIADIHGVAKNLQSAVTWAKSRNNIIVLLGDILDYGPNNVACVEQVYDLLTTGQAIMCIGNHERKIQKWLASSNRENLQIKITEGNRVTINELEALTFENQTKFVCKFNTVLNLARNHWVIGDFLFAHAAAEPEMFGMYDVLRLDHVLEGISMFGEIDKIVKTKPNGYPNRVYNWVNRIPQGKTVVVGHDIRNKNIPLVDTGTAGGTAVFLDTGCGKGGSLSSLDILFQSNKMSISNFNRY